MSELDTATDDTALVVGATVRRCGDGHHPNPWWYEVHCDLCGRLGGTSVSEGNAWRNACAHLIGTHAPRLVSRPGTVIAPRA